MLWRSLRDVAPSSATLAEDGRAELIYPDRREIRAWPSFESLATAPAGGARPAATEAAAADLAASLARTLGGSVTAVSARPIRPGRRAVDGGVLPTVVPGGHLVRVGARDDAGRGTRGRRSPLVAIW